MLLGLAVAGIAAAELDRTPLEAVTVDGERVRLFPNGRWEYVDAAKAVAAQQAAASHTPSTAARTRAAGGWLEGVREGVAVLPGIRAPQRRSAGTGTGNFGRVAVSAAA